MASQQLYATNVSVNMGEALEARIKDPLWFLARQWQTGEFEAENGGSLAATYIAWREYPLGNLTRGDSSQPVPLDAPLDALVEAETAAGNSPAWSSERSPILSPWTRHRTGCRRVIISARDSTGFISTWRA